MIRHLKTAGPAAARVDDDAKVRRTVEDILGDVERRGDVAARELSIRFDGYDPPSFRLRPDDIDALVRRVPDADIADIRFVQAQIRRFAETQRASMTDNEVETLPGVVLGYRHIPVRSVGCYVPGEYCPRLCILEGFVGHAEHANVRVRRYGGRNVPFGEAAATREAAE